MAVFTSTFGRLFRRGETRPVAFEPAVTTGGTSLQQVDIAPNDPLLAYLQSSSGAVDIDSLALDSPGVQALRESGMKLVVPLINQGELIGLLNLGPRLSEQEYSADDKRLLGRTFCRRARRTFRAGSSPRTTSPRAKWAATSTTSSASRTGGWAW
jgi:hypothetical protein